MAEGALDDVVVLELAAGTAGPYCGKLLADFGAQVIKVEPEGGDPARAAAPLVAGESAYFAWLNGNKLGATLALDDPRLEALASHADVVIHDARGAAAGSLDARLVAANPAAVVLSLTPYGRSGGRAGWQAAPLTEWATGGFHYIAGDPARSPLALPGPQAEYHAGLHAGIAALAGLWHSRQTGEGQCVEISHQEATLSNHAWLTTTWTHTGTVQARSGSLFARCADGYVYLFHLVPYPNLFVLMERFDLLADEDLQLPTSWQARFGEVFEAFAAWAATRTKQEVYHACQELRIAASPVATMADVAASAQLAARQWYGEVRAGGRTFKAPGFPYRLTVTPNSLRRPAPRFGEHTALVTAPGFAWANAGAPRPTPPSAGTVRGPLTGVRVIEVTANWAGPCAGRDLADLGAEVIKIELVTKPATRSFAWLNDDFTWPRHYDRSGYFNKLNRNKKAICLDLAKPLGKQTFLSLVDHADVVIENNAVRVMGNLGLSYAVLGARNPRLVMCSLSGFGSDGPEAHYSAYGSNIETLSGLSSLLGYGPGEYFATGSYYADPATGNHAAIAIMAALHARRRSGRGQWIDMSLLEAVAPFFAASFLEYTTTGVVPEPVANRSRDLCPHNVYPAAGRDCWLAVAVRDETDFAALCRVTGFAPRPAELAPGGVAARRAREAEIDAAIARWAAPLDHNEAARRLQAAGVPGAPVMANWELFTDNHLNDRGFFVRTRHEEAGTLSYPGFPWRFEKTPASLRLAGPMFAEHNREVFGGLLGLAAAEIRALYDANVTADEPNFAAGSA